MNKIKKTKVFVSVVGGCIGVAALTFGLIFSFILYLLLDLCENQVLSKSLSPSGERIAYVYKRGCGATTDDTYHLSILNSDDEIKNKGGNTFHTDKKFDVTWKKNELIVGYPVDAKVYEQDKRVSGIEVKYIPE